MTTAVLTHSPRLERRALHSGSADTYQQEAGAPFAATGIFQQVSGSGFGKRERSTKLADGTEREIHRP